ncbi:hypothetical protein M0R45_030004 [Rubus argutus]|uniref:Plastocyanin-like domain-containing protein n=1 Tax=Rubus argutus TaxID=59490 RepID=A0AAW1WDL1_RUBAR
MVASTRFTKTELTGLGIITYTDCKGPASPELPSAAVGWPWSLNQFRSFRWNLTASAARPNPQGSYKYGGINITRTIKIVNSARKVDGKLRYAVNGVSHVDAETPFKLEYFGVADKVFNHGIWMDTHSLPLPSSLGGGPEKRRNYNLLDAVSRHTVQVYPNSWAAIMLTFDNAGMWNLRSAQPERAYLGQQLYVSVPNVARSLRDEYNLPETTPLCGIVKGLPQPPPYSA